MILKKYCVVLLSSPFQVDYTPSSHSFIPLDECDPRHMKSVTQITVIAIKMNYDCFVMKGNISEKITYKKILVTHDGSEFASAALPHAIAIAKVCNAEVLLLHVVDSFYHEATSLPPFGLGMYPSTLDATKKVIADNMKQVKHQLEKLKIKLEMDGVKKVTTYVDNGFPREIILDVAKTEQCDLIIMATRGRSGLGRVVLGSVADYVIRHADCPVLTIHPKKGEK